MMRIKSGIVCVLAALAVGACSWGNGSGSGNTSPDAAGAPRCGDNICAATEVTSCPQDCGNGGNGGSNQQAVCGNGQCETTKGESATSCPSDCGGNQGSGGGSGGNTQLNCSDPNTQFGCLACTVGGLCSPPYDAVSCAACGGGSGGGSAGLGCVGGLPNGTCDPGEDNTNCPFDCP